MSDTRIALVTGANQGIGLQIAKDLVAKGLTVLVGSRNLANGEAAAEPEMLIRRRAPCGNRAANAVTTEPPSEAPIAGSAGSIGWPGRAGES